VWLESKLSEMLDSKRPRKSTNVIKVCSPMERLVVLTQDSNDASTMLWDFAKGVRMVLKYERTLQSFRLRRTPIN
jgi:hypothetical protein